jgi:hypothetical protein
VKIAQTAQATLATQVKNLEAEINRQKEDLAFFDSLLPTNLGAPGITIQRFKAEQAAPNQLRYRVLVMQGGGERNSLQETCNLVSIWCRAAKVLPSTSRKAIPLTRRATGSHSSTTSGSRAC